jgi:hypothetical protein
MNKIKDRFTLEFKEGIFTFEVDNNFYVWLINSQNPNIKDNIDHKPAKSEKEARDVAVFMLHAKGLIKKESCETYLKKNNNEKM